MSDQYFPVDLPSKCFPYAGLKQGDIQIRPYNGEDEQILAQINPSNLERNFLQVLSRVVKGIDPKNLTLGDRSYLIILEYINSYCEQIKVNSICSHCLNPVDFSVDLRTLHVTSLPDNYVQPVQVHLPVSQKNVGLRLLTVADEIEIEKFQQKAEGAYLYRWARSIDGVDPVEQSLEMKTWSAKDIARIRLFHEQMFHGPDTFVKVLCPKCGQEEDVSVPFRLDFFLPVGSVLRDCFGA